MVLKILCGMRYCGLGTCEFQSTVLQYYFKSGVYSKKVPQMPSVVLKKAKNSSLKGLQTALKEYRKNASAHTCGLRYFGKLS